MGDLLCVLEGIDTPVIARWMGNYLALVVLAATLSDGFWTSSMRKEWLGHQDEGLHFFPKHLTMAWA